MPRLHYAQLRYLSIILLAWLAVFFLICSVLRDRRPKAARAALVVALALGSLFSLGRMLQGAHFLSHNLWPWLFDWGSAAR